MVLHINLMTGLVCLFIALHLCVGEDYYDILGVSKDADNREIRKAFKKLILTLHPDKNQGDPQAHEKFLKVYKAYEVLKDEDLRKRYDTHGEGGLADQPGGRTQYESWKFYQQNFGIYDEDPEIVTLSRSDFEQAVERAEDTWFINYYSPHCSHCHDLAPTWRELARELSGVIRIGAVNCEDDYMLCRQQGVNGYPSLVMYPKREQFQGVRNLDVLLDFALERVRTRPLKLTLEAYDAIGGGSLHVGRSWLITFCGDDGDCLSERTCLKLSAIFEGLVNIATVDCSTEEALCSLLGRSHGSHFYSANLTWAKDISSLETKEIANAVLQQLPDVTIVDADAFYTLERQLMESMELPWLLHFTGGESLDIELRKLPALLGIGLNVGRISCLENAGICQKLYIHKFPTFVVFKQGGGYEVHYEFSFDEPALWSTWKSRFLHYAIATKLTAEDNTVQISTLIYCMGAQAEVIYGTFSYETDQEKTLDPLLDKFDNYFLPRRNIMHNRAMFNRRCQHPAESTEAFVRALQELSSHCEYGALKDELIRDRLVVGLSDLRLCEELQLIPDLTLTLALQKARQTETVKTQLSLQHPVANVSEVRLTSLSSNPASSAPHVSRLGFDSTGREAAGGRPGRLVANERPKVCRNCNLTHEAGCCPARNRNCNFCRKTGHYAVCCRSRRGVKEVTASEDNEIYSVEAVTRVITVLPRTPEPWQVTLFGYGTALQFKIDSGADVTVMTDATYARLRRPPRLDSTAATLYSVGSPLECRGTFQARLGSVP